jgi:hypothetical protein
MKRVEDYPLTDVPWADARASKLEEAFGPAASVFHVPFTQAAVAKVPPIHVWVWPDIPKRGLSLLITEGLSDVRLRDADGKDVPYAVEILTVTSDPQWAASVLRAAGELIVSAYDRLFMSIGETMSMSNPIEPLAKRSKLTRLAFLVPPASLLKPCEALMGFKIRKRKLLVLWCVGISESELAFLESEGDEDLRDRLENEALDFRANRKPLG